MYLLNLSEEKLKLISNDILKNLLLDEDINRDKLQNFLENYDQIFKSLNDRIKTLEYFTERYFDRIKDFESDLYNVIDTIEGDKNFQQNYKYLSDIQSTLSKIVDQNTEIDKHDD